MTDTHFNAKSTSQFISPYSPNTDADRRLMLDAIGVGSADDLFLDIPEGSAQSGAGSAAAYGRA